MSMKGLTSSQPSRALITGSALCFVLLAIPATVAAQTPGAASKEQAQEEESPWLLVPTVSSDPKVGTTLGALGGYVTRLDEQSTPSMLLLSGKYSNTDSWTGALFGQMFFDSNRQRLTVGYVQGLIRNDYDDFLGSGQPAQTTDNLNALAVRYMRSAGSHWYLGVQALSSNYSIGADQLLEGILEKIGLTGFDSNGLGLIAEYDARDHPRNPASGTLFRVSNIAYRQTFGGDESFDVYNIQYNDYRTLSLENTVVATQLSGRATHNAPVGGYSSVNLRGYVRGQSLAPHFTSVQTDARIPLGPRWGASAFAGVGCLYENPGDCGDSESLYPMAGGGAIFLIKKDAGLVLRAEYAQGKSGNSGFYLALGHPF
ncbi:hypothetical protein LPB19_11890 [Marinobacter salinisoli]|uniref:Bacterial surface antigen (D15) domain-containing protein n=1 Tax=Marinobacter salinisoli TaxID=2769486 RepID=A0ABX7MNU6_9GAMM|nr:hypothetical protein [Marinobacter salinisoli]QSP93894.1 hypothetical protein LPB19_11890 [Marinobacter salinisoli]